MPEIRRPKTEIRRKPEIRDPNPEPLSQTARESLSAPFGLRVSDFLRISALGFRISARARNGLNVHARPMPRRPYPHAPRRYPHVYRGVDTTKDPLFAALFHALLHSCSAVETQRAALPTGRVLAVVSEPRSNRKERTANRPGSQFCPDLDASLALGPPFCLLK